MTLALSYICWSEGILTAGKKVPQRLTIFLSISEITSKREDCLVLHISVAISQVLAFKVQFLKIIPPIFYLFIYLFFVNSLINQLISSFTHVCLCGNLC